MQRCRGCIPTLQISSHSWEGLLPEEQALAAMLEPTTDSLGHKAAELGRLFNRSSLLCKPLALSSKRHPNNLRQVLEGKGRTAFPSLDPPHFKHSSEAETITPTNSHLQSVPGGNAVLQCIFHSILAHFQLLNLPLAPAHLPVDTEESGGKLLSKYSTLSPTRDMILKALPKLSMNDALKSFYLSVSADEGYLQLSAGQRDLSQQTTYEYTKACKQFPLERKFPDFKSSPSVKLQFSKA